MERWEGGGGEVKGRASGDALHGMGCLWNWNSTINRGYIDHTRAAGAWSDVLKNRSHG